ncbi:hypothetical protein HBI18_142860 [Parastagonospora nodorum]|nr:hypothetical protein HBH82_089980 [Parastagonospora nodorum]KAH4715172.1 hypothetical protein HBH78_034930 [Parastagonospora nodorum]KAH4784421.1 hypothetical protein HBH62_091920 [Parastagonospora nodorum]KAH4838443.1 hypothetical protein HBH63_010020 [Parastagonospora nodorum]KAH5021838.1 hypothetical protein HBI77_029010 [Parastagonospora nodorum]
MLSKLFLPLSYSLELETPYIADTQVFEDPTNAPSCVQIMEGLLQLVVREYVPVPLLEIGSALVQTSRRVSFGSKSNFDSLPHPRVHPFAPALSHSSSLAVWTPGGGRGGCGSGGGGRGRGRGRGFGGGGGSVPVTTPESG